MLSSSLVLGVYLTVQNLQKPSLYLRINPKTEFNQAIIVNIVSAACYFLNYIIHPFVYKMSQNHRSSGSSNWAYM